MPGVWAAGPTTDSNERSWENGCLLALAAAMQQTCTVKSQRPHPPILTCQGKKFECQVSKPVNMKNHWKLFCCQTMGWFYIGNIGMVHGYGKTARWVWSGGINDTRARYGEYNMVISSCVWYGASMEMPLVDTYTDSVYYCVLYVHVNMPGIKQDKASRCSAV